MVRDQNQNDVVQSTGESFFFLGLALTFDILFVTSARDALFIGFSFKNIDNLPSGGNKEVPLTLELWKHGKSALFIGSRRTI